MSAMQWTALVAWVVIIVLLVVAGALVDRLHDRREKERDVLRAWDAQMTDRARGLGEDGKLRAAAVLAELERCERHRQHLRIADGVRRKFDAAIDDKDKGQ